MFEEFIFLIFTNLCCCFLSIDRLQKKTKICHIILAILRLHYIGLYYVFTS